MVCKDQFISYLKAHKLISKGCVYHIMRVRDVTSEVPYLELIPIVNEFSDVFYDDLSSVLLEREIGLGMHFLPNTQYISISLYHMYTTKLK